MAKVGRVIDEMAVDRVNKLAVLDTGTSSELLSHLLVPSHALLESTDGRQDLIAAALRSLWPERGQPGEVVIPDERTCAQIAALFHQLYYYDDQHTWRRTVYRGVHIQKCPLDLWRYMEIVASLRPDLVIETDAKGGGTALLIADLCDSLGRGRVVTMGIEDDPEWPRHPRITYWHGDPMDPVVTRRARSLADDSPVTLVFANSSHRAEVVRRELETYGPLVTPGSYMIIENTNIHGHPVRPDLPDGPLEGVRLFLVESEDFEVDRELEGYWLTFNPSGYLRKRLPEVSEDS